MKDEKTIQPLPNGFIRGLWDYRRVDRIGPIAIYERWRLGQRPSYETIIIRVQGPRTIPGGKTLPWREVYPSPSQFGKFAWSFDTIASARAKFRMLESCLRVVRKDGPHAHRAPKAQSDSHKEPKEVSEGQANLAIALLDKMPSAFPGWTPCEVPKSGDKIIVNGVEHVVTKVSTI
jgi:hypothetical protein